MNNLDAILGEFILLNEGLPIVNKRYVGLVGMYYRRLLLLPYQPIGEERRSELVALYKREFLSSKFWASYPEDVSSMSPKKKRGVFMRYLRSRVK